MRRLFLVAGIILSSCVSYALSLGQAGYQTQSGYSQADGASSGSYINYPGSQEVRRYLYSAYQRGFADGNMRTNMMGMSFERVMGYNHFYVRMNQPGYSQIDVYFQKDARYSLRQANLSILERQEGYNGGRIDILLNGRQITSSHSVNGSASGYDSFTESTWDVASSVVDGLNQITIRLNHGVGFYGLLGVKVETREALGGGSNNQTHVDFVNRTFQKHHFRYPTTQELTYYTGLLQQGQTFSQVEEQIRTLNQGDEYTRLVDEYFLLYAKRAPTQQERIDYAQRLRTGQLSLPEFRRILEAMAANPGGNVQEQIRNIFYTTIQRYPTTQELAYYGRRIQEGSMTWDQLRREVALLGNATPALTPISDAEMASIQISTIALDEAFFQRLQATRTDLVRVLLRKAQYAQMNPSTSQELETAKMIILRVNRMFPGLF